MQTAAETELDRALALIDAEEDVPRMPPPWRVAEVSALPGYELSVRFRNDVAGLVKMRGLIFGEKAGVFAVLRDPALFAQAYVEEHWVAWPVGLDIAPDAMYDEIKAHGEWILR